MYSIKCLFLDSLPTALVKTQARNYMCHNDMIHLTCMELNKVKNQANTVELELIVRIPNIQVSPRRGSRMTEAMNSDLFIVILL